MTVGYGRPSQCLLYRSRFFTSFPTYSLPLLAIMKPIENPVGWAAGATNSNRRRGPNARLHWRSMSRTTPVRGVCQLIEPGKPSHRIPRGTPTSISVQHHVPQGVDLLDGVPVCRPHLVELREVVGDEGVGRLIGPEEGIPARMHVQATLAHFGPVCVRSGAGAERNVVDHGRDEVGIRSSAGLVDAVVRKGDIEVVVPRREVEAPGVATPDQRKRRKCVGIVEEAPTAPEPDEHEGDSKAKQAGMCAVDTNGKGFCPHIVIGEEKGGGGSGGARNRNRNRPFSWDAKGNEAG